MNVRGALGEAATRLAPGDARLLLAAALGVTRLDIAVAPERALSEDEARRFRGLVERRFAGEPASRILGRREFWSLELEIGPAVLDPRPDTETVVEAALEVAGDRGRPVRLLDLGVGSGCILLALLSELPKATGVGVDRSEGAIRIARRNAENLDLDARAHFVVADWAGPFSGGFDLVVSNPPYIPRAAIRGLAPEVARHDPAGALDGGEDGLVAYRQLTTVLPGLLKPGAAAALEIGLGQAASVSRLLEEAGLELCGTRADLAGRTRCLIARKL